MRGLGEKRIIRIRGLFERQPVSSSQEPDRCGLAARPDPLNGYLLLASGLLDGTLTQQNLNSSPEGEARP